MMLGLLKSGKSALCFNFIDYLAKLPILLHLPYRRRGRFKGSNTPLAIAAIALRGRVAAAPAPGSGDRFNGSYPTTLLNSQPDGQTIYLGAGEARRKPRK